MKRQWCIPYADARYVVAMEEVLAVYQRAYEERKPLICMDEGSKQLVHSLREAEPVDVGHP